MTQAKNGTFANSDVDSLEDITIIHVRDSEELWLSFTVGVANLSAFNVDYRCHPQGGWFTVAGAAGDYTSPTTPVLDASGDLTTAAFGSTVHYLRLDVHGIYDVRIQAAGTSSTITGHFGTL